MARRPLLAAPRALPLLDLAAAGDVDAPIIYAVGAAVLVSAATLALIPIFLKPGQEAADKIFTGKQDRPLDKQRVTKVGRPERKTSK